MIDVSQWRASIGLWNYCQAASTRPANGRHSHSFKAAVDSKSGSTTSGEKTSKIPAALSFIALLLLLFHSLSLIRHILMIPPTGNCYQVQCTTGVTDTNYLQSVVLPGDSSSNLIYNDLYLIVCLRILFLLSGDVELNPGPTIDDRPDLFLLLQRLEPLVDWQSFGLLLPGITKSDIKTIEDFEIDTERSKEGLFCKWLNKKNPTATWRDVLNALTQREEINLLQTISDQLQVHQCRGDAPTVPVVHVSTVSPSVSEPVTSTTSGIPKDILQSHSYKLVRAISVNLCNVTDALHAEELIPQQTKEEMLVLGITDNEKASKLVNVIETQLEVDSDSKQYLIKICHVLVHQQHSATDIVSSMLKELGYSMPDVVAFINSLPNDVQGYADNMRIHYKNQPIVVTNWPPKIREDLFGRLALVEKQDSSTQVESKSAWHMLRGQVDKTVKLSENKEISFENVLQPTYSSLSLRVLIDGPPGIGKTTLCRKLLNMWSNGPLPHQQYDLVLYCPLRNSKIATATTLPDLFEYESDKVLQVVHWLTGREGKGLLIIFDGWDELSEQLRQSSLAASIIRRRQLNKCSVIVTSRSYASYSLLDQEFMHNLRHVQVIGFSEEEISTVIIQTLQKNTKLAQELIDENIAKPLNSYLQLRKKKKNKEKQMIYGYKKYFTTTQSSKDSQLAVKLINDLKVRNDVQSLCYVPLVCSMVILVYCKEGGHLPTTLTQLYENFILQTIGRHVKRHGINPHTLDSQLSSLPSQLAEPLQEMCQLAYTNLANKKMTFSLDQLQSLSEEVKEDYLGLMTTFTKCDKEEYQFLHLSIQEFLAAWWIAKHEKKAMEVFKDHFNNDHFRMCLRFVAGLTHLDQQYFNKQQLDLQCKRKPLFGFQTCHLSYFYPDPEIRLQDHISSDDFNVIPILLVQLLYESQNTALCQVLAQSINNHSLCLKRVSLSLFDSLCLSYCINNSNTTWNHLHLGALSNQALSVFTAGLTNNSLQTKCKRLEVCLNEPTEELIHKLLQSSLLYNIQECYCELWHGQYFTCLVLLQFLNLPKLKILHLMFNHPILLTRENDMTYYTNMCSELEKHIEKNSILQEMKIKHKGVNKITSTIIRGVTRNKTITLLTIHLDEYAPPPLPDGVIEQLLKDNNTLKALSLNIPDELLPSSLNIVEVNTPLIALEIGRWWSSKRMTSLLPRIKGLQCLVLHEPYPPHLLHLLFDSHPSLHTLTLPLDTAESAIELFTMAITNVTLKALRVNIQKSGVYTRDMSSSLQDVLKKNQTLKYIEINDQSFRDSNIQPPFIFLSSITNGLIHNTNLQQLSVPVPLNEGDVLRAFINAISQNRNLTELQLTFRINEKCSTDKDNEMSFYERLLPAVANFLQSSVTIKLLQIEYYDTTMFNSTIFTSTKAFSRTISHQYKIAIVTLLYESIFVHPSLEYFNINASRDYTSLLRDTLKDQKKTLIDKHRRRQPHKPLPIVTL